MKPSTIINQQKKQLDLFSVKSGETQVPAAILKPGNQGIGTCSTRHGILFALDIDGH